MTNTRLVTALSIGALLLGGCAYHGGSADYRAYEARGEQSVRFGVVEAIREVRIDPRETGVGSMAGTVLGGMAGSHVGRGSGEVAGVIGGAILGGIIGHHAERAANERRGVELTVLLDSGRYVAVVQEADESFRAGDRVRILSGRGSTRVTH